MNAMTRLGYLASLFAMLLAVPGVARADAGDHRSSGAAVSKLPGLESAARVTRDAAGIAHVRARSLADLFFMQGYVHAQDRLFQMDVTRRLAGGRLAELLGSDALESDVQLRTLGLRRAAERSLPVHSARTRAALDAYARGVNAWVERHQLPPEYALLEISRFEPWTQLDSVTVSKLVSFSLSFSLEDIDRTVALLTYQGVGTALSFDGTALLFEDLQRSAPFLPASTVPDAEVTTPLALHGVASDEDAATKQPPRREAATKQRARPDAAHMGRRYLDKASRVPLLRERIKSDRPRGSNEWVVAPRLARDGHALIANDPHLALTTPSTFYPMHLTGPGIDVIGNGFAGTPLVTLGQNRSVAWGATINPLDATDVYQEQVVPCPSASGLCTVYQGTPEPVIPVPESYRFNATGNGVLDDLVTVPSGGSIPAATLVVPRRNHGPIIDLDMATGQALSVQYTGWGPTRELDAIFGWNTAENLEDFVEALQHLDFGSINIAYADVDGNIGYFAAGEAPVREDLQAGTVNGVPPYLIRNGGGGNEWLPVSNPQPGQALAYEILPFDEMPQAVNPPAGFIVNANNDPAGHTLDNNPLNQLRPGGGIHYLNYSYFKGFRAARINERIDALLSSGDGRISLAEMQAIQSDVTLVDAEYFVPFILAAYDGAAADPTLAALAQDPRIVEAVGRLAGWDFTTPTGIAEGYDDIDEDGVRLPPDVAEVQASVAATLYGAWRSKFVANVIDSKLDPAGMPRPSGNEAMTALRHLLDNFDTGQGIGASGVDFFQLPFPVASAEARRDLLILLSLSDALDALEGPDFAAAFSGSVDQDDYRWGRLHRVVLASTLGGPFDIPPAGGAIPDPLPGLPGLPTDGGFNTVDASTHDARAADSEGFRFTTGPVNRYVAQMRRRGRVEAESIWPGGTSGVLGDPFYANMLPQWLTNETVPLLTRPGAIKRDAVSDQVFVPAKSRRARVKTHRHFDDPNV